jgi:hypothetical protein
MTHVVAPPLQTGGEFCDVYAEPSGGDRVKGFRREHRNTHPQLLVVDELGLAKNGLRALRKGDGLSARRRMAVQHYPDG